MADGIRSWALRHRTRLAVGLATAAFAGAVIGFARGHSGSIYDDALIYLRYVRNLDNGCGLRFNCSGPAVEGFTGPLYLALLWLGSLVTHQLIALCQIVDTLSLIAAGGLAIATAAALATPSAESSYRPAALAVATAFVLGLDDFVLLNANIGMETALAAAACALVAWAAICERPRVLAVAVVAGVLARPEGMVFVLALPLLPWMRHLRHLVPVAGALVAIVVVRYAIFGHLAPMTYYAKAGGTWRHVELGAAYVADAVLDFPLVAFAPLALLGARRRACTYLLVASAGWLAFFLKTGGDTFEYSRLWFPLVPALTALALAGIGELAARVIRHPAAIAVPLAAALLAGIRAEHDHAIPDQHTSARVVEWAAVGTYLRTHYPRGSLVATVPIGAIGYYSSLPILDLVGLVEPEIALAGRTVPAELLTKDWLGHERHNTEHVLARAPVVIVTTMHRDHAWTALAEAKAGFWADWLLLQEITAGRAPYHVRDAEVQPGDHVLMFERDSPEPSRAP